MRCPYNNKEDLRFLEYGQGTLVNKVSSHEAYSFHHLTPLENLCHTLLH